MITLFEHSHYTTKNCYHGKGDQASSDNGGNEVVYRHILKVNSFATMRRRPVIITRRKKPLRISPPERSYVPYVPVQFVVVLSIASQVKENIIKF